MMTNKKLIFGSLIILLIIMIVSLVMLNKPTTTPTSSTTPTQNTPTTLPTIMPLTENMSCEEMYTEIENDFDKANYCKLDADCKSLLLGGPFIKFGCYKFVNKYFNEDMLYEKMGGYYNKCQAPINKCAPAPEVNCISGRCVRVNK